jgi:uncharacterized protein
MTATAQHRKRWIPEKGIVLVRPRTAVEDAPPPARLLAAVPTGRAEPDRFDESAPFAPPHRNSLQCGRMSDVLERFFARLDPILERFDRLLAAFAGRLPGPDELVAHQAFRWRSHRGLGRLEAIEVVARFDLEDLIGVAPAIDSLDRNTRQLISGLPFNDVLLFGARGTGKSSAVRGLLARYAAQGLRLVEVDRSDLAELPELLAVLHRVTKGAPERYSFLVFCDDLSFGTSEVGFRELKAALEGGIEARPSRVCVVVTSNRRHLLPETMAENREARLDASGELHLGEALEEKLALADRFGLALGFYPCDQTLYLEIVAHWLAKQGISTLDDSAREAALRYALERGGRSGRVARQFSNEWVGRVRLEGRPV